MLFQHRFHPGIESGRITRTVRAWDRPRVTVGRNYRLGASGFIQVDAVDSVALGSLRRADARKSGFTDPEELTNAVIKHATRRITSRSKVFRVEFHYIGKTSAAHEIPKLSVEDVLEKLDGIDRRSKQGAWTRPVLRAIRSRPRTAASQLAPRLGFETQPFKANVRKLKALGLTRSLEKGYELTPLGEKVLNKR